MVSNPLERIGTRRRYLASKRGSGQGLDECQHCTRGHWNGSLTLYLHLILTEDRSDKIYIALGTLLGIIVGRSKLDNSIGHLVVSGLYKDR